MQIGLLRTLTWAGAIGAAAPAHAQALATGDSPAVPVLRIVAALAICGIAALGLVVVLRGRGKGGSDFLARLRGLGLTRDPRIEVVEARRISAHADICLVRSGGKEYLLLCGVAGLEVLDCKPAEPALDGDGNAQV